MTNHRSRARKLAAIAATAGMAITLLGGHGATASGAATRDESICGTMSGSDVLYYSMKTDRSNALPLQGASIPKGSRPVIFVVTPVADDTGASTVKFHLDQIDDGLTDCSLGPKIEHAGMLVTAPASGYLYDFNGGTTRKANAYSTSALNRAEHTITVIRSYSTGDPAATVERRVQAQFTVS